MPLNNMDPRLTEYLGVLDEQKKKEAARQQMLAQIEDRPQSDYNALAGIAKAASQLGTIGGKSADTSSVTETAQSLSDQQEQAQKNLLGKANMAQEAIDKQTGLKLKTLDYLQSRKDRDRERAEDRSFKQSQLNQQRELAQMKMPGGAGKLPTGEQFKAGGFARRIEQSAKAIDDLAKEGFDRTSPMVGFQSYLPNIARSPELQRQEQAERNFINAVLRRESGAAISPSEFENAELQYFPRTGDSPDVLAQKKQNRDQTLNSIMAESGNAYGRIPEAGLASTPSRSEGTAYAAPMPSAPKVGEEKGGYVFKGGDPSKPESWEKK